MIAVLWILGWFVCGFVGCRLAAKGWYRDFGDYEGYPWGFIFILGPFSIIPVLTYGELNSKHPNRIGKFFTGDKS